jgi:adenosylmethionine-8-amino-7-oxononanoate aminotransferase
MRRIPKKINYSKIDAQYIWHPFTQMKKAFEPIQIVKGKGVWVWDNNGNKYLDAISSWWVNIHGHSNKTITTAIATQAKKLEHVMFDTFTHEPAALLAKELVELTGSPFKKIFFSDNGSTAVEVAIKMAIQFWYNQKKEKPVIIAFKDAYHGDTFGSMSVGARNIFNRAFEPFLFEVKFIDTPINNNTQCIEQFKTIVKHNKNRVAAFIFEPLVMGASGMLMYKAELLDELIRIAKLNKIICIADEVMTGFGRTGKWFAIHYLENKPDIIALSKAITGGFMPLGATLCSQEIFDAFLNKPFDKLDKTFFHGHSYTGNPLACAAAKASIELLKQKNCWKNISVINKLHSNYASALSNHPRVKNAEVLGTILAIRLKTKHLAGYLNPLRDKIYPYFLKRGIILRPLGNVIYVLPPYVIKSKELKMVYNSISDFIDSELML